MINLNKTPKGFMTGLTGQKFTGIYTGIVMSNSDAQKMGRLAVWIPELGGTPSDERYWTIASYASPFAGSTNVEDNGESDKLEDTQKSYGFWMVPPDTGNEVLVVFANGDQSRAYWIACVYQQYMNSSVPAMGMMTSTDPEMNKAFAPLLPPGAEYNKKTVKEGWKDSPARPAFSPLAQGLIDQGLAQDPERGPASSSARRYLPGEKAERGAVSSVYGFSTPRGSGFVVDDNPANEFIRMRTRSGAQILVHETSGYIYMITRGGNSWMEISDSGIDVYSAGPISLRSESDFNIQADGDVNIDAGGSLNMRAGGDITAQSGGGVNFLSGAAFIAQAMGDISLKAGGNIAKGAGGDIRSSAGGDITEASGGLNIRCASMLLDNAGGAPDSGAADATVADTFKIGGRSTIVSRSPTHEPFNHGAGYSGGVGGGSGGSGSSGDTVDVMNAEGEVSTVPAQPVPAKVAERARMIYRMLKKQGWSDEQCAGILGSWQQESNLNPGVTNGIGATGLAQWLGSRARDLQSFANKKNANAKDAQTQVDFFLHELNSTEGKANKKLKAANNPKDATTAMNFYERYGGFKASNPTGGHEVGKRYQYSVNHYNAIKKGEYA